MQLSCTGLCRCLPKTQGMKFDYRELHGKQNLNIRYSLKTSCFSVSQTLLPQESSGNSIPQLKFTEHLSSLLPVTWLGHITVFSKIHLCALLNNGPASLGSLIYVSRRTGQRPIFFSSFPLPCELPDRGLFLSPM